MAKESHPSQSSDDFIGSVGTLAGSVARLGFGLLAIPIDLLPQQTRRHMHNAIRELNYAFAELPRSFAERAGPEIERWAAEGAVSSQQSVVSSVDAPETSAEGIARAAAHVDELLKEASAGPASGSAATLGGGAPAASVTPHVAVTIEAPTGLGIAYIEYDPPGRDVDGEYVLIRNDRTEAVDLSGWQLADRSGNTFTFARCMLQPGATTRVWTGVVAKSDDGLAWGRKIAAWNNSGDTARLLDSNGEEIARYTYVVHA
ncbi:lamin tail domain-containing protein [Candidatus Gracilibacteria bacterium]|nr:lamin tail domain-containing protein [Candidatus Gracilibacteria bacterium]